MSTSSLRRRPRTRLSRSLGLTIILACSSTVFAACKTAPTPGLPLAPIPAGLTAPLAKPAPPAVPRMLPASLPSGKDERAYLMDALIKPIENFALDQARVIDMAIEQRDEAVQILRDQLAAQAKLTKALAPKPFWKVW